MYRVLSFIEEVIVYRFYVFGGALPCLTEMIANQCFVFFVCNAERPKIVHVNMIRRRN